MTLTLPYAPQIVQNHLLSLKDYSPSEILDLLALATELKKPENKHLPLLQGKVLGMIFEKSSTRTRVSFEAGMLQLGGHAMYLSTRDIQMGRGESIADTAQVLSGYLDGIMIRTFHQATVEELADHSSVPVINGLTDDFHPCQVLADLLTIQEHFGTFTGKKMAYIGDANNMSNSLMIGAAKVGMDITIACPAKYAPKPEMMELAKSIAAHTGANIHATTDPVEAVSGSDVVYTDVWASMGQESIAAHTGANIHATTDPVEAVSGSDVVYTDVWASMGQESEALERIEHFKGFQVNEQLVQHANPNYIFMHCLPAHREEEVTTGILEGPNSVVFQEAENRLHAQKALLVALMGKEN